MAPAGSPSPSLLLSTLAAVAVFSPRAMAQQVGVGAGSDQPPADDGAPAAAAAPAPVAQRPDSRQRAQDAPPPAAQDPKTAVASTPDTPPAPATMTTTTATAATTAATTTSESGANPTITGGPSATTGVELTGFPTLTRGGAIPTYPPPAVPPTHDAPFMQHSNLPDGTVFIAVGAILGAFGLAILLYRAIVSLLLHRSVKRAAMAQHVSNSKAGFPAPPAPFYKYTDQESSMSLSAAAAAGRGVRRTNRGPVPSATPSHSNLFFSPTAVSNTAGSRASAYMPSGFYAAPAAAASGTGSGSVVLNHQANSISLHNLRPDSRGHYANGSRHTLTGSPPDSPQYHARREAAAAAAAAAAMSATSLHLSAASPPPPGRRAPSAYLEDLLADDAVSLPPPAPAGPSDGPSRSTTLGDRTDSMPNRT